MIMIVGQKSHLTVLLGALVVNAAHLAQQRSLLSKIFRMHGPIYRWANNSLCVKPSFSFTLLSRNRAEIARDLRSFLDTYMLEATPELIDKFIDKLTQNEKDSRSRIVVEANDSEDAMRQLAERMLEIFRALDG